MIRAHKNAILARLRADSILAGCTFEGLVLNRPDRYCSVFSDNGFREQERYTGPQSTASFSYTIHSIGTTPEQAQLVAERVFAQLLDFTPTVAGRNCRRIRHEASRPVAIDQDVKPPLWYCVDVFDLTSSPA